MLAGVTTDPDGVTLSTISRMNACRRPASLLGATVGGQRV